MPRKASHPSLAEQHTAPGGAITIDRALSLLSSFRSGDGTLTLSELAQRTRLYKSTVLRLLASLVHGRLIQRRHDGRFALGPEIARLNALYVASFTLEEVVIPALRELVDRTGESASFHVPHGQQRLCLFRVDSDQPLRDHIKAGDLLPLDRGAGGRILRAFAGAKGPPYAKIRRDGFAVLSGDRVPELAGISAPVFNASAALVGAVTLTMPVPRLRQEQKADVLETARRITLALGGTLPKA